MSKDVELLYVRGLTVPKSIGKGRVLVHNFVPQRNDTAVGVNGFCAWMQLPEEDLVECDCGWSGLPHYR